jgi:2-C-methyl-D-erythritol 4-phosphate cytidylyltransferase
MIPVHNRIKHVAVVIPAGGQGARMGGRLPKQFLRLGGMSILERTVRAFQRHPQVGEIVIASPPHFERRIRLMVQKSHLTKVGAIVPGGGARQDSVWQGIRAVQSNATILLIHDAVRPFVRRATISAVIAAAVRYGAAVPALPARETLHGEGEPGTLNDVIDRSRIWAAQTPQGFDRNLITRAFQAARDAGYVCTDDASLVLRLRHPVHIVVGTEENVKITTRRDLRMARLFLGE